MKLFNIWDTEGIKILDPGLGRYINLNERLIPRTAGRNTGVKFHKSNYHIVERLMNKLMIPGHKGKKHKITSGHTTGKVVKVYNIVEESFRIIEKKLNKNPVEVFVKAIENSAPREEITTIEYGGARYPKAVECSPQRRIDIVLRFMTQGAYAASFNKKKSVVSALSEEIINAYNLSINSNAIAKKNELERQADSSR
ncbi:MAG: 30S ribosomal protein S7 [Nanoarchaeota archaeon]|nr:30S ribosomal protein S7 [Nanoarchaeota archaeon]|tara:strand:+ start:35 stop:625 length:591 start_codon:yes stop_codon:yes gene_type:complete